MPVTIKDAIEVAGLPCTSGAPELAGHVPAKTAPAAQRLIDAGAVVFGKTNLALDVLAGPHGPRARGWRLALPPPRRAALAGARIAVWLDDPACPVSAEVGDALQGAVEVLARAGAQIEERTRPVDARASRATYLQLLYGVLGAGFPPAIQAACDAGVSALDPAADSLAAHLVRGVAQRHRDWLVAHERRLALCARWEDFFRDFDALLAPVTPTVAFPHDHSDINGRTIDVDGRPFPYLEQLFWAGLATVAWLPATAVPVGRGRASGLPVGLQIVGPFLEDRTPLALAGALAERVGGFTPPPAFA